jgi:hypothetical protein
MAVDTEKETAQMAQSNKRQKAGACSQRGAKALKLERKIAVFLESLKNNGGHVSAALSVARLARRTAYDRYNRDPKFADDWNAAVEAGIDELYHLARCRALGLEHQSGRPSKSRRPSDRLLMFLIQRADYRQRWRGRLVKVAQIAVDTIRNDGPQVGLSSSQIDQLEKILIDRFNRVPTQ